MKIKLPLFLTFVLVLTGLIVSTCGAPLPETPTSLPSPVPTKFTESPEPSETAAPATTKAPTPTPTEVVRLNPSARGYTQMAYDSESKKVILFGGQTGNWSVSSNLHSDTWVFDPTTSQWTLMKPVQSPEDRSGMDLVYDSESDRVILFGGGTPKKVMNDTWAYDYNSNTWEKMSDGPSNHLGARLAYDGESDRVILFGGFDMAKMELMQDTWAYNFNTDTWTNMEPQASPPGRNFQAMSYDSKADRVLTYGGFDINGSPVDVSMWAYDFNLNSWEELKSDKETGPGARDYPEMTYNSKSGQTFMYGGLGGGNKSWAFEYKTNKWTRLDPPVTPERLSRHTMIYSPDVDRVILFGGQVGDEENLYTEATWSYDFTANTWTKVNVQP